MHIKNTINLTTLQINVSTFKHKKEKKKLKFYLLSLSICKYFIIKINNFFLNCVSNN